MKQIEVIKKAASASKRELVILAESDMLSLDMNQLDVNVFEKPMKLGQLKIMLDRKSEFEDRVKRIVAEKRYLINEISSLVDMCVEDPQAEGVDVDFEIEATHRNGETMVVQKIAEDVIVTEYGDEILLEGLSMETIYEIYEALLGVVKDKLLE